jgi:hypothetical protein
MKIKKIKKFGYTVKKRNKWYLIYNEETFICKFKRNFEKKIKKLIDNDIDKALELEQKYIQLDKKRLLKTELKFDNYKKFGKFKNKKHE